MPANRVIRLVLVCVTLVAVPLAHASSDGARALLVESVEAMGGGSTSAWTTRVEKGLLTTSWEGWGTLNAVCSRLVKKPDKMKIDEDFSAFDHPFFMTYYYNGGEVWAMVNLGVRQHPRYTERVSEQMKTVDGVAYYVASCDTFFHVSTVAGDSLLTATEIDRVGVVDDGDTVLIDLDRQTRLPRRTIDRGGSRHTILDQYRSVGGRKVAFHVVVYENGEKAAEYVWEEIKFDEPLDDTIFEEYRPPAKDDAD